MKIRAVIFDIYNTLLEVGPPPTDAEAQWEKLCREAFAGKSCPDLRTFNKVCDDVIAREHAAARAMGIQWPEVYWPEIMVAALPELARFPANALAGFALRHARLVRTVRMMPGAKGGLSRLRDLNIPLGLASNAQPYTLAELESVMDQGYTLGIFRPGLRFFSYEHGFSKPDPHVFRLLGARLRALGIAPEETLMVGDRFDRDIMPARAQGFQTWQLGLPADGAGGDWSALNARLPKPGLV